jgi:hypothetical protein
MFGKSKVTQSMIDAVNQVIEEKKEIVQLQEYESKGGVYRHQGSGAYGTSKPEKHAVDTMSGPKDSELKDIENEKKKKKEKKESVDFKSKFLSALEEDRLVDQKINEVMSKDASAGDWIHDFVKSDNPKFAGKSKSKRKEMALAAYYAKQRNEEAEIEEELKGSQHKIDKNKNKKIDAHDFAILRGQKKAMKEENDTTEKVEMVQSQLHFIKYACEEILEYIDDGGEVEEWYQVKVAKSFSEFESLHAYIEGESRRTGMKEEAEDVELKEGAKETAVRAASLADKVRKKDSEKYKALRNLAVKASGRASAPGGVRTGTVQGSGNKAQRRMGKDPVPSSMSATKMAGYTEEFELNEVSKSEVEHHFHNWTNSEHAPYHRDAGDDNKVHQSALRYLSSTNVPKENHEKLAMHIAHKFHGSGIDEAVTRKHFQQVADLIKTHDSHDKRKELAQHHAEIFANQNPRFDKNRFYQASNVKIEEGKQPETDNVPFAPPYNTTSDAVVTDKSGAKHTPMSRVKHLARQAMQKVQKDLGKK